MLLRRFALLSSGMLLSCALGCSSTETRTATLVLDHGKEADAFTKDPRPTKLIVNGVTASGNTDQLVSRSWPSGGFDIGDLDPDQTMAFEVLGVDATGATVVRGASVYFNLWSVEGVELPLFVGRTREMSRPTGALPMSRRGGVVGMVASRFIVHAGGTDVTDDAGQPVSGAVFDAYDLGWWRASGATYELPRTPQTMAIALGQFALLIDDLGASWFDFASYDVADATPPEGMSFSEVAGGDVVYGPDAESYVVGATRRAGSPTNAVLRLDPDGTLTGIRLGTARAGASAAWVTDRGLVVTGGEAQAPGAEVLASGATAFAVLPQPPDETQGAASVGLEDGRLLLVGGLRGSDVASSRVLDLSCLADCVPTELTDLGPVGIERGHAFTTRNDEVLVVGDQAGVAVDPPTKVMRLSGWASTPVAAEVPLRDARTGAVPIPIYGGAIAIVGGVSPGGGRQTGIEIYMPQ